MEKLKKERDEKRKFREKERAKREQKRKEMADQRSKRQAQRSAEREMLKKQSSGNLNLVIFYFLNHFGCC